MPLSRLDNFLKNVRGNILYVNPNDLDATDSVENQGNSMGRPFLTIQRALIEAARFSYQVGLDNDRFGKTTIMLSPAEHVIDNRPGWIPNGLNDFQLRDGTTSSGLDPFSFSSNFDVTTVDNVLYKLNSIHGGVIVPRGVSLVGQDLRKTKIRPLYVPNPENDSIERSSLFRLTGGCYLWQFSMFDANPNGLCYKDYTTAQFVPNFSHHKLTCFEYADGSNGVNIDDDFVTYSSSRTDLDMYYEKVGLVYGSSSGRSIEPDYPSSQIDIQTKVDEFRIVGPTSGEVGITSIKAGDGSTSTEIITATLTTPVQGLDVDTTFIVNGVADSDYNGSFAVQEVLSVDNDGQTISFTYQVPDIPVDPLPAVAGSTIALDTDTVTSSSPYIFNISLRSVYGMCGMHADGQKSSGFKSMIVAQFTGVSLQKDDNAFLKFNQTTGRFDDSTTVDNLHSDPNSVYKPSYYNFHIKTSNNAVTQQVSIFAIGYAQQFVNESGGDSSITNSNSNFGQNALISKGFREESFTRDDVGYISHIVPPRESIKTTINVEFNSIDVDKTVGVASTGHLYLYQETNNSDIPESVLQGYRVGAKVDDNINVIISKQGIPTRYYSRIVMPNTDKTSAKTYNVGRSVGTGNSISSSTLTFTEDHGFINGESIRLLSDNARLPDGLDSNRLYYAITSSLGSNQIQLASTLNDALDGSETSFNNAGGNLIVESRVSDKISGDIGHPIQYDNTVNQWYINVSSDSTQNTIYDTLVSLGTTSLGEATPRTFITRSPDTRKNEEKIYTFRYVVPAGSGITSARAPRINYVIQQSNKVTGDSDAEVSLQYNPSSVTMTNSTEMRNFSFLRNSNWDSGISYFTSERPHGLVEGSEVVIKNVQSSNNTTGVANSAYNGKFIVSGISSSTTFTVDGPTSDPGFFQNNTSLRSTSLPTFQRSKSKNTFYIYDVNTLREYVSGDQDGVYYLTVVDSSNTPVVAPFNDKDQFSFPSPIRQLYPQYDRDNPQYDPKSAKTYSKPSPLGDVDIDDPRNSITKKAIDTAFYDFGIGIGITDIISNPTGTAHTIFTEIDHGLNRATVVSVASSGAGYGNGTLITENLYNAVLTTTSGGQGATSRITVDPSGSISDIEIMNSGSFYQVGDVMTVTGTATTTGFSTATVQVTQVNSNIGDTIRISGISSISYEGYNQLYRITGITTANAIEVESVVPISGVSVTGVGITLTQNAFSHVTGQTLDVSSVVYNNLSGFATVTTVQNHGIRPNNKIFIGGSDSDLINGQHLVTEVTSLTTLTANIGVSTLSPSISGTIKAYMPGLTSQEGLPILYGENFGGRVQNIYDGITTTLSATVSSTSDEEIEILNIENLDINIGDYLRIDDEIVRVKRTVSTNPIRVFRGLFGTRSSIHQNGSVVRRIRINNVELRRPSIIRASGHTFEYQGYGPGNYSTALPDRQDTSPTLTEQTLSQSFRSDGGLSVYTGMNDKGDYFVGNRRLSSTTGKADIYNTPVPTITGEDVQSVDRDASVDIVETQGADISGSIKVSGGINNNFLSEFDGPVVLNKKVTSTSDEGIESVSIFLQGDATISRKYTVGISTPTVAGNPGDVVYNANPAPGGVLGWTYTTDNNWHTFGSVSLDQYGETVLFDKVGIATNNIYDNTVLVGSGLSEVSIDGTGGVGIGTSANGFKLHVFGGPIRGTFEGDGSALTNLDSIWTKDETEVWAYPKDNFDLRIGIGTTTNVNSQLRVAGTATTSLEVDNESQFNGDAYFNANVNVGSGVTLTVENLIVTKKGDLNIGLGTIQQLHVGTGGTILSTPANAEFVGVGIGTTAARAALDVEGDARFKSYHEIARIVSSQSGVVTLDLSESQTFLLTTSENISSFTLIGAKENATTAFTLKILQGSTAHGVGIDTFRNSNGNSVPVYWPGGVLPIVTPVADKTDIYSFMTFDGGSSLFGVVGGQNFS
jgi:hypothetical protein